VADSVRQDRVPAGRVEELSGSEEHAGKVLRQELRPGPAGAVKHEHRVGDRAGRVAAGASDRPVVEAQLRQNLARPESEVAEDEVAGDGLGDRRRNARGRDEREKDGGEYRQADGPALPQATSQRRASRRASEKRTTEAPRRKPTWGARATSDSSRQNTFMKPSIAHAFSVMSPIFCTLSERR